ncbi:MAG: hypothetical protein MUP55_02785 [Candidatus Aenigmarchaeota archaeon]|nr:hypothetical protein [Candidatus Aenigmarchaeota archaeon]
MAGPSSVSKVMPYAGTLKSMVVLVHTNTMTVAVPITEWKNGIISSGPIAVSIGAGVLGKFYDSTHTEAFAKGDSLDTKMSTSGNAGTCRIIANVSYEYVRT